MEAILPEKEPTIPKPGERVAQKGKIPQHTVSAIMFLNVCLFFRFWGAHSEVEFLDHIEVLM